MPGRRRVCLVTHALTPALCPAPRHRMLPGHRKGILHPSTCATSLCTGKLVQELLLLLACAMWQCHRMAMLCWALWPLAPLVSCSSDGSIADPACSEPLAPGPPCCHCPRPGGAAGSVQPEGKGVSAVLSYPPAAPSTGQLVLRVHGAGESLVWGQSTGPLCAQGSKDGRPLRWTLRDVATGDWAQQALTHPCLLRCCVVSEQGQDQSLQGRDFSSPLLPLLLASGPGQPGWRLCLHAAGRAWSEASPSLSEWTSASPASPAWWCGQEEDGGRAMGLEPLPA